ncbi:MAG: RtcB family protein [Armatimonadetes bacterium]|nr:RtcB family protein [Armatimonadota bacterium]
MNWDKILQRIDKFRFRLPKDYKNGMRVDGLIYANSELMESIKQDQAIEQVANVAFLPGIERLSLAMPDIHWGYGFPVGGVAATRVNDGVISPGGIGYDINCGVRLLRTSLTKKDIKDKITDLVDRLFYDIPCGVGREGRVHIKNNKELAQVLKEGASWSVKHSYGDKDDLEYTEAGGCLEGADPDKISKEAYKRGINQLGTLGAGNHFLEIQEVVEIFDKKSAQKFEIFPGQITILIHTGSRGLGHQVCTDYLVIMGRAIYKYAINLPDRQLACVPIKSQEGEDYLSAMASSANFAWANRQCITHFIRESFEKIFKKSYESLGIRQVYDVAHNIAKMEEYEIEGKKKLLCVHRKGATRAFPAGSLEIPLNYREVGQPVLVPGDMGRYSFILVSASKAKEESFSSACHGAGRLLSRSQARKIIHGRDLQKKLLEQGIYIKSASFSTLAEEAPEAYKDVEDVVDVCEGAGISRKVAKMKPLGVIKG